MRVPFWNLLQWRLRTFAINTACRRPADETIPPGDQPGVYMRRWYIYRNKQRANLYLHQILRSDDDRALHDHPWPSLSLILKGEYWDVTPQGRRRCKAGDLVFRRASAQHRLELIDGKQVWSLFLTGRKVREWGFYCPQGFVHHKDYGPAGCAE